MTEHPAWWPTAELATLQQRAELLRFIREFFFSRNVLEVETPILTQYGSTEVHLDQFQTNSAKPYFLNTSAELAMKRLLAAGYGDIYQISKVFRADEQGQRHEPEFTMLEWYRTGFDLQALIDEVIELIQHLSGRQQIQKVIQKTYHQAFIDALSIDPLSVAPEQLKQCFARHKGYAAPELDDKQSYLDLLMSELVEPSFEKTSLTIITQFPAEQASLARINPDDPRVAERFELFAGGLELANGFYELNDLEEQARRMQQENERRSALGKQSIDPDKFYCAALEHGLPDCSGVALGIDRLMMYLLNKHSIQDVKSFSTLNA